MTREPLGKKYNAVAMAFHWVLALLIIFMLWYGHYVHDLPRNTVERLEGFQMHYSIGLTILVLSILRLGWRMMHPAPPLVSTMKKHERILAKSTHHLFYLLIIILPLAGWATASTSRLDVPIMYFETFQWPWFPLVHGTENREVIHEIFEEMHIMLGWATVGLVALHFLAVLKHTLQLKDGTFSRMWPGK